MNPALGSEVRDCAEADVRTFVEGLDGDRPAGEWRPPALNGDVRQAYVAAFCAELMAAEGITLERLRDAIGGAP